MAAEWEVPLEKVRGEVSTLRAEVLAHIKEDDEKWSKNSATHDSLFKGLTELERAMATRLPVWATFLIGGLMSLATWGLTRK